MATGLPAGASQVINPNDTARLLAGMPPSGADAAMNVTRQASWQQHARNFDTAWAGLEKNQLLKVRTWAKSNIADAYASKDTMFYMFSGPDYLYANTFFPNAATYVLCGMEPIGPLPDVSGIEPDSLGGELRALRESLDSVLSFSFFRTKAMKDDFKRHSLGGTLPVLYIFLARSGKTIGDVGFVQLDSNGTLTDQQGTAPGGKSSTPGVRIHFTAEGSDTRQTLYYFSTDISDSGLKKSGFLQFCGTLAPGNSCVKSASYLMHESYFSGVRNFLLDHSKTLVQDDSGIPCSYFKPEMWRLQFFGSYPGPIQLFKEYYQPKLAEYYRTSKPAPLDFGIGYRHRTGESTLIVSTRQSNTADSTSTDKTSEEKPLRALPVVN